MNLGVAAVWTTHLGALGVNRETGLARGESKTSVKTDSSPKPKFSFLFKLI